MLKRMKEGRSILKRTGLQLYCAALLALGGGKDAQALTVTGTVEASGKYLVSGTPVNVNVDTVLKMSFENVSLGTNLELCAGTSADFIAGVCPARLSDSAGPGFRFVSIVDASSINGKLLYIIRVVGTAPASFVFTVE